MTTINRYTGTGLKPIQHEYRHMSKDAVMSPDLHVVGKAVVHGGRLSIHTHKHSLTHHLLQRKVTSPGLQILQAPVQTLRLSCLPQLLDMTAADHLAIQ